MGPLRPLYFCRTLQLHYTVSFFSLIETKLHTKQNNFIENVAKFLESVFRIVLITYFSKNIEFLCTFWNFKSGILEKRKRISQKRLNKLYLGFKIATIAICSFPAYANRLKLCTLCINVHVHCAMCSNSAKFSPAGQ